VRLGHRRVGYHRTAHKICYTTFSLSPPRLATQLWPPIPHGLFCYFPLFLWFCLCFYLTGELCVTPVVLASLQIEVIHLPV
jgi:hypothetical protein